MRAKPIDLVRVARLRASGFSWGAVAKELGVHESTVSRRTKSDSTWSNLLAEAEVAIARETTSEAVMLLRQELRAEEPKDRRDAAAKLLRYTYQAVRQAPSLAKGAVEAKVPTEFEFAVNFLKGKSPKQIEAIFKTFEEMNLAVDGEEKTAES